MPLDELESIQPFTLKPWEKRVQAFNYEKADEQHEMEWDIRVAVSSSARNGVVGVGGVVRGTPFIDGNAASEEFSFTLGPRMEQNPYSGELAAIAHALNILPNVSHRRIALLTTNKAVALSLRNPRHQSGQVYIRSIYKSFAKLWWNANGLLVFWIPTSDENELLQLAKREARQATKEGATPARSFPRMKSTTLNFERRKLISERSLPDGVGKHSKRVDAALPGLHTRQLYNDRPWVQRSALAQMRTDMTRLNNSLYRIHVVPSRQCACGHEPETVAHFLFRCIRWEEHRAKMYRCTDTNRGSLSFFLGGRREVTIRWTRLETESEGSASSDPLCTGHWTAGE